MKRKDGKRHVFLDRGDRLLNAGAGVVQNPPFAAASVPVSGALLLWARTPENSITLLPLRDIGVYNNSVNTSYTCSPCMYG